MIGRRVLRSAVLVSLIACVVVSGPVLAQQEAPPPPPATPPAQPQPRVAAIEVRGNTHVPTDRILAAITHLKVGEPLTDEKIREDIRAVNELGVFADVTVRTETEADGVRVVFLVTENPVIAEVLVEGNTVLDADEIRRALGVATGEVLDLNRMREGTRAVQKLYEDRGYVLARVTDTAIVPVEGSPDQARLRVRIAEGTVEAVRFEGLRKTRLSAALRYITETRRGAVFNVGALNRDLQRLFDTGLFEAIRARPEPGSEPDSAVIVVEVTEARTAQIGGGLGYTSREGLIGFVEYRDRNWRGLGQSVAFRIERALQTTTEGGRFNYELSFSEPFFDQHRTGLDLGLYARSAIEQEYTAGVATSRFELQRTGSFIALNRPLDPVTTGTLRFKSELTLITPLPLDAADPLSPVVPPSLLSPGRVVSIALSALRDSRDDRFRPGRGQRLSLNTEFGLLALGGDFGFTKYILDYQRVFPAWGRSVFVARGLIASASGTLPLQEQFLLGGPSTVRSLSSGKYRGNSLMVMNLEYRFSLGTIIKQLGETQGILFADAGSTQITTTDLKVGYGVGVAVSTPIGPIRLDFAWGPEGQQTWISLGAPF